MNSHGSVARTERTFREAPDVGNGSGNLLGRTLFLDTDDDGTRTDDAGGFLAASKKFTSPKNDRGLTDRGDFLRLIVAICETATQRARR